MATTESCDSNATRLAIDEELTATEELDQPGDQERILLLKSRRNHLAPISRLPTELLSLIFDYYIHDPELRLPESILGNSINHSESTVATSNIEWGHIMRIVSVCQIWHSTALNSPHFWSQIIFTNSPHITKTMLLRAKESPLYIRINEPLARRQHRFRVTSMPLCNMGFNLQRVRELHLFFDRSRFRNLLSWRSGRKADQLWSLLLVGTTGTPDVGYLDPFSFHMPSLRRLEITRFPILWDSFRSSVSTFSKLDVLKITFPLGKMITRSQFYDILSALPTLRTLHLCDALPECPSPHSPSYGESIINNVSLPNLTSCTIKSSLIRCVDFHMNVSYPTTTAQVNFSGRRNTDQHLMSPVDHLPLLMTLLNVWGISHTNPERTYSNLLLTNVLPNEGYRAVLWDGAQFPKRLPQRRPSQWDDIEGSAILDFSEADVDFNLTSILLRRCLQVSGLRRVGIHGALRPATRAVWSDFFERHEGITHIHLLRSPPAEDIIAALRVPTKKQHRCSPPSPRLNSHDTISDLLPHLTTFIIEDVFITPDDQHSSYSRSTEDSVKNTIMAFLTDRHRHGIPLQLLHFESGFTVRVDTVKQFSGLVGAVTWTV